MKKWWRFFRFIIFLTVAVFFLDLILTFLTPVSRLVDNYPHPVIEGEKVRFILQKEPPPQWVPLSKIPSYARWAVIVSEDGTFYQHKGIDVDQIMRALEESYKKKRLVRGASTITQQLVKNIYLSKRRNIWRKVKEVILALRVERVLDKKRILELYLNVIEVRPNTAGIAEGSLYYFRKKPSQLNPREAAFLAMLLPGPKKYSISFQRKSLTRFAQKRIKKILSQMAQVGAVSWPTARASFHQRFFWEK